MSNLFRTISPPPSLWIGCMGVNVSYLLHMSKLKSLQKKVVKIIGGGTTRKCPTPFYGGLKILKVFDLYKFEIAKLVHDFLHDKLPSSSVFFHLFQKSSLISHRSTRSSSNKKKLHISLYRTNRLQRGIRYHGVSVWNSVSRMAVRYVGMVRYASISAKKYGTLVRYAFSVMVRVRYAFFVKVRVWYVGTLFELNIPDFSHIALAFCK